MVRGTDESHLGEMHYQTDDTITAIATARGGGARGIIRISGPEMQKAIAACFRSADGTHVETVASSRCLMGEFHSRGFSQSIPAQLYIWPNEQSYTRQPLAELHTLGSPPVLDAVLNDLCDCGARLAEPGEFTMRAFLAGRLDLTQAEAVLEVIDARSGEELGTALNQLAGGLSTPLSQLRDSLLDTLSHLEAGLDFVEEDIEFISTDELTRQLRDGEAVVMKILDQLSNRGQAVDEIRVVILGWPNAGKSSLLNALAGDNAAIVSEVAGTTRDYVARHVEINGLNCLLIDTAGVEPTAAAGVAAVVQEMTRGQVAEAEVAILCIDGSRPVNRWERAQLAVESSRRLIVLTKTDLSRLCDYRGDAFLTSSRTGEGMDELRAAISGRVDAQIESDTRILPATAARCRTSIQATATSLARACSLAQGQLGDELVAAELRVALEELSKVVGAIYTDDILDRIFSRFCIGK